MGVKTTSLKKNILQPQELENASKSPFLINSTLSCKWGSTVRRSSTHSCCCSPQRTGNSQVCYSVRHNLGHRVYRDRNSSLYHRIREGLQNRDPAPVPANYQTGVFHSMRNSVRQCTGMNVWSSSRLSMSPTQRLSAPQSTRKTVSINGRDMAMIRCGLQLLELARVIHMKPVLM